MVVGMRVAQHCVLAPEGLQGLRLALIMRQCVFCFHVPTALSQVTERQYHEK